MPTARFDLLKDASLTRRITVTVAVLAVYRLAAWVPLPGVNAQSLAAEGSFMALGLAFERVSIVALGIVPWLTALVVVEVGLIVSPRLRAWSTRDDHRALLNQWIVGIALLVAGFQAAGIANAMENIAGIVPTPGLAFRLAVSASLVAATALTIWLASLIDRYGIGSGFWVLLAVPHILGLGEMFVSTSGSDVEGAAAVGLLAVCVAALACLRQTSPVLAESADTAWAVILGYTLVNWLLAIGLFFTWSVLGRQDLTLFLQPATIVALTAFTVPLVGLLRGRSLAVARGVPFVASAAVPQALVLGGLVVATSAFSLWVVPLNAASAVMLASVALVVFDGISPYRGHSLEAQDSQSAP